jgi:hypothetical protein
MFFGDAPLTVRITFFADPARSNGSYPNQYAPSFAAPPQRMRGVMICPPSAVL